MEDIIPNKKLDIRGLKCPYTFVRSKLTIEAMDVGQVLEILLDYQEASNSIPKSMEDHGHKVLRVEKVSATDWIILIRKERD
ncbi:sulfurtransferase TusA family protein [Candidatus Magnetomonas plexicatena]|uniref:sulfurtransferase TusA family protein n=1 Tax=Candidatus Magnetomonas plexicatena TaxID=2552947 RepID=UPI001C78BDFB|nr:sulfurtransferase TusA family protein [Nitrospirales bacterium LBB_01]